MKLPISIAQKMKQMLEGEEIQSSKLNQAIVLKMVEDGAIQYRNISKTKRMYFVSNAENLINYLFTEFGINSLAQFVEQFRNTALTRGDAVEISSNSKIKTIRTFKGFLVNCYQPILVIINGSETIINPIEGTFTFIYDYDTFHIPADVTIVGIENSENFRHIKKQAGFFQNIIPLFICRYPQNKDFIKWMKSIPNKYLHFGDFDFEGINIFLNEYKRHLGDKAQFFIPRDIEKMIKARGSSRNYDTQIYRQPDIEKLNDEGLMRLINLIHKHKKGLEQEYLIKV